jgi:hypothetical protein
LRDRLVVWLTKHGQPTMESNGMFIVEASVGEFEILYRTPFTRLPQRQPTSHHEAWLRQQPSSNLPYGLDVFFWRLKVMNVEWDDRGRIDLVVFRSGPWEDELVQLIDYASP